MKPGQSLQMVQAPRACRHLHQSTARPAGLRVLTVEVESGAVKPSKVRVPHPSGLRCALVAAYLLLICVLIVGKGDRVSDCRRETISRHDE